MTRQEKLEHCTGCLYDSYNENRKLPYYNKTYSCMFLRKARLERRYGYDYRDQIYREVEIFPCRTDHLTYMRDLPSYVNPKHVIPLPPLTQHQKAKRLARALRIKL